MLQLPDTTPIGRPPARPASSAPAAAARRPALTIAPATPAHALAIAAIYRAQIESGLGSFEDPIPDAPEMARRLAERCAAGLPALVALDSRNRVLGFAWASPFRLRAHYRHTVEDSVHVHPAAHRQGVGETLLRHLVAACAAQGRRQMVAVVGDARNRASIRLHEKLGFVPCGYLAGVGARADGEPCDAVMLQRALGAEAAAAS